MKIIEQYSVPTIYVDDFCDHHLINGNVHAVGYRVQPEDGEQPIGVIEVRLIVNAKNFFAACHRGVEMAGTGELPPEKASVSASHH